jgi:hypothetical protein
MPRDPRIKRIFEVADDGMQGIVGYFHYVSAAQHIASDQIILEYLPKVAVPKDGAFEIQHRMKMFHEWDRYYNPVELVQTMSSVFTPYHIRTCILGIVSIFEAFLSGSIDCLVSLGKQKKVKGGYKKRLEWVFQIVRKSSYGNASMQNRIPQLCLDIDHARRIRNLWMHNNGNFNREYKKSAIDVPEQEPIIVPEYQKFIKKPASKVPFPVDKNLFKTISKSHIEALHHIHNMMQKHYFGQKQWYGYTTENKKIEWNRVMFGV